jgi:thiosulfate/3-mercaptopyruvate sulfurtransferase
MSWPHLLASTGWLAEHLHDSTLRIIDIRGLVKPATEPPPHYFNKHQDYLTGHIPGAVFIDWVKAITDPADPRHAQIAPPERFAALMSGVGIDGNSFVVAYDDGEGIFAARLWWALHYYGHDKVAVLDGGYSKWLAEGRPTETDIPTHTPTTFIPNIQAEWRRTGDQVAAAMHSPTQIVDVRTPAEYRGEASRAERAGHIPSAVNLPRTVHRQADGTMFPPEALREQFGALGINVDTPEVIFHCNGGVSASYSLLALQVAGLNNGTLYDGSWKDWGNDPTKPIHTGDEP